MVRALAWHARGHEFESRILHKAETAAPSGVAVFGLDTTVCTMWPLNASFSKGGWEDCQKRKNVGNGTFAHEFESRILHKAKTAAPSGVAVFGLDAMICTMWPLNASFPKGGWEDLHDVPPASEGQGQREDRRRDLLKQKSRTRKRGYKLFFVNYIKLLISNPYHTAEPIKSSRPNTTNAIHGLGARRVSRKIL